MKRGNGMGRMRRFFTDAFGAGWPALLLICLLLAACGQETPTPLPAPPPPAQAPASAPSNAAAATATPLPPPPPTATPTPEITSGTVTLWHSWARADGDALGQILADFAAANPQMTVQTLFVAYNDLPQAYADAVAAGGGPDLILAPAWWLRELADAGALLPLADRLAAGETEQWQAAAVENLSVDGTLFGLPTSYELVGLYYNRALVAESELPRTSDDLLALAAADPAKGSGLYLNFYHLYWGIPAYGGELFDAGGEIALDQTPGAAQFLAWLKQMDETPGNFVSLDYGMLIDRFKKGEFAFFVDGPWSRDELAQALGENLGLTPLPAGPAGPARPWLSSDGVFLNPTVDGGQQQLALRLARHIASGASGTILGQTAGRLPAHREAQIDNPLLAEFAAQARSAFSEPHLAGMSQVWGYAGDMLVKVIDGGMAPDQAVRESAALLRDALGAAGE